MKRINSKKSHAIKILTKTMPLDFTLTKFRSLCTSIAQHYPTLTLSEYFQGNDLPPRFAMMRHDIDRKPGNALFTASVEARRE
ncbi:MAG: hypothetical protein Q7J35_12405 [Candidatus Methanoperedens sp.]|nr:hypothetical protein [Candidatus Methanoperedens sp.]